MKREEELHLKIKTLTNNVKGDFSYYFGEIKEIKENIAINEILSNDILKQKPSASMIKVLIMETLFNEVRLGNSNLMQKIKLAVEPKVQGGGALQELMGNNEFTLLEYCRLMIVLSDNWATNLLISYLSMDKINARAKELGLKSTILRRKMMDFKAKESGFENYTSVNDLLKLYLHIFTLRNEANLGEEMWQILGRQQFRDKLPASLDEDIIFHHKTGVLENIENDGGIFVSDSKMFAIIIMTSNLESNSAGIATIAKMGECIFEYIQT